MMHKTTISSVLITMEISARYTNDICSICLSKLKRSSKVRLLCKHEFHKKCIDYWFASSQSTKCPMCRSETELITKPQMSVTISVSPLLFPQHMFLVEFHINHHHSRTTPTLIGNRSYVESSTEVAILNSMDGIMIEPKKKRKREIFLDKIINWISFLSTKLLV